MRHLRSGRKLNRSSAHRKALMANMATSLLDKGRIQTTVAKAKELRGFVERLITFGKKGTLHARRLAARNVKSETVLKKLFDTIAPEFAARNGGYTRVLRAGANRRGDSAEMAIIELVGYVPKPKVKKDKKAKEQPVEQQPVEAVATEKA